MKAEAVMTDGRFACSKRRIDCQVITEDGRSFFGRNSCAVSECARLNTPTGLDYDACGSEHAEVAAVRAVMAAGEKGIEAFLYGHTWMCGPCQEALQSVGVHTFYIDPRPLDETREG